MPDGIDERTVKLVLIESGYSPETAQWLIDRLSPWALNAGEEWWNAYYQRLERLGGPGGIEARMLRESQEREQAAFYADPTRAFAPSALDLPPSIRALSEASQRDYVKAVAFERWLAHQRATKGAEEAERLAEAERKRERMVAEREGLLMGMEPTAGEGMPQFLQQARGVSPAFQRVAEQQLLPDIFAELGMTQKRKQWWEKGVRGIAEQLLPETSEELELMALKRADPWAQLLSQPTFLQQLETRFRGLSPAEKGVTTGRFRPRTRFLT